MGGYIHISGFIYDTDGIDGVVYDKDDGVDDDIGDYVWGGKGEDGFLSECVFLSYL